MREGVKMIKTEFKRNNYKTMCKGCLRDIEANEPSYFVKFEFQRRDIVVHDGIRLCEDCGNRLQDDMTNDYLRFKC